MYASIDLKWFDKNRAKMVKTSVENMGDDGKDTALVEDMPVKFTDCEFDGDEQSFTINIESDLGYFSIDYPLSDDEMMELVKHMKSKGERIRELIKLAEAE